MNIDLFWVYKMARQKWNNFADEYNQWYELDKNEKLNCMKSILMNEYELNFSKITFLLEGITEEIWFKWEEYEWDICEEIPKTKLEMLRDFKKQKLPIHSENNFRCPLMKIRNDE